MNKIIIIPMIATAFLILFLLGHNLTGWVIGQSCCFPPNCDKEENICSSLLHSDSDIEFVNVFIGALIAVSILGYGIVRINKIRKII